MAGCMENANKIKKTYGKYCKWQKSYTMLHHTANKNCNRNGATP